MQILWRRPCSSTITAASYKADRHGRTRRATDAPSCDRSHRGSSAQVRSTSPRAEIFLHSRDAGSTSEHCGRLLPFSGQMNDEPGAPPEFALDRDSPYCACARFHGRSTGRVLCPLPTPWWLRWCMARSVGRVPVAGSRSSNLPRLIMSRPRIVLYR